MNLLSEIDAPVNIIATQQTLWGLVGLLAVIYLVFAVVIQAKKLFGRKPAIDDDLKKLRQEIYHSAGKVKKDLNVDFESLEDRFDKIVEDINDIKLDRERKWQQLTAEYHSLDLKLATLTGRIETLLKKLEGK